MFGDKSSNVFWNMIKNQKENKIKSNDSSSTPNKKPLKKEVHLILKNNQHNMEIIQMETQLK